MTKMTRMSLDTQLCLILVLAQNKVRAGQGWSEFGAGNHFFWVLGLGFRLEETNLE